MPRRQVVFPMKRTDEMKHDALIAAALEARAHAYAPYSNHPVGAAILADDGNIYSGCNVENAAYPLGFCSEPNAIGNMVMGGGRYIKHVVIAGPGYHACTPCGGCRQQLREFADINDVAITICDVDGKVIEETKLSVLLPQSFGPDNVAEVARGKE